MEGFAVYTVSLNGLHCNNTLPFTTTLAISNYSV